MLRKNRKLTAVLLTAVMIMACTAAGCGIRTVPGPDLEESVAIRELCYFEEDFFSFTLIYDYEHWKEIKDIEIPALGDARISIAAEDEEGFEKYGTCRVDVRLAVPVKKDTLIEKVIVTWDDDTKTTVDIGQATLLAGVTAEDLDDEKEGYDILEGSGGSMDAAEEDDKYYLEYVDFSVEADRSLTGVKLPSKKAQEVIEFMQIDGVDLEDTDFSLETPLEDEEGDWYQICWEFNEKADQYGIIQIPAFVMGEKGESRTPVAVFSINKAITSQDDVIDFLKQVL